MERIALNQIQDGDKIEKIIEDCYLNNDTVWKQQVQNNVTATKTNPVLVNIQLSFPAVDFLRGAPTVIRYDDEYNQWVGLAQGIEWDYAYNNNKTLTVALYENGNYKINYLDTMINGESGMNNAGSHNSQYRELDITELWTNGDFSAAITAGTFENIYPGSYIIIPSVTIDNVSYEDVRLTIGELNYFNINANHVLAFTDVLGSAAINNIATAENGYSGSDFFTLTLTEYVTGLQAVITSSHLVSHPTQFTSGIDSSSVGNGGFLGRSDSMIAYANDSINLMTEPMIFGSSFYSSSPLDSQDCNTQIAAFRYNRKLIKGTSAYWTRAIASTDSFAAVSANSEPTYETANTPLGIRLYLLLK